MDFNKKVVLITGATGGIGKALAAHLAAEGANLALFARRKTKIQQITADLGIENDRCIYQTCDVVNPDDVKKAVTYTYDTYGKIDVALLTAGILIPNPIQTLESSIIKTTMKINFFGVLHFIENLLPIMKKQHHGIIATTSTLPDKRGVPGWGAYGASKAAVSWFIESLRAEGKQRYNIDFITIKPGSVLTPMIEGYHRRGAITPEKAATYIINGIKQGKKIIQFPLSQVIPIRLIDLFPPSAYDSQDIELLKGDGYPEVSEE
jgi:NADP-dependent 3-hydroxy acid dehydrogenase YdfG